ncbi:MAG: hypothetical protein LC754_00505 [Acidobacteria bacterium]|nr:hypothetical protein [Acidobacteriota bacterium]
MRATATRREGMSRISKFQETLAMYRRHGWQLSRVLMSAGALEELRAAAVGEEGLSFENVPAEEAPFDAMWFTRAAQGGREAWELRLIADSPYALFELFEPDEEEEDRADVRREMEARMREYAAPQG